MNRTAMLRGCVAVAALAFFGCKNQGPRPIGDEAYATIKTTQGDIVLQLFPKEAPKTVENFVGLATGTKEWKDPATGAPQKKPLYNGTKFHRVIPNFMIQGGDPLGTGVGGPGYKFQDETSGPRKFDKVGLLAMANSGPNTNGSQFFITTSTPGWLNGKHTIFGEVIAGYDVVQKISAMPGDGSGRPAEPVVMNEIVITDKKP